MRGVSVSVLTCLAPIALAACATARPVSARGRETVRYDVAISDPASQYIEVQAAFPGAARATNIALPAWTPGSYLVRDFGKHVYDFAAHTKGGADLPVVAVDKHTWRVDNRGKPFVVSYRVFAATRSVRTSHVDDTHASLNGASVFVFEPGHTNRSREVAIDIPQGWEASTALPQAGALWEARDYDALVDSPIELGTPSTSTFELDGTRFEYVLTGADLAPVDESRLVEDARKVATTFGEMMGGFPMKRYVFFMHITEKGGGGLEHADSTVMMMRRTAFDDDKAYESAARLTAHEFFHLWNVKRIHDTALGPFDYLGENYTRLLWFHEGLTETMESLSMRRGGTWSATTYLERLASSYTTYRRKPGRDAMPISEVSMRAWTHAYQPEDNHPNVTISYYEKGDIVGVALDLEIRTRSEGRGSIEGMFRRLMAEFGAKGQGIEAADVVRAASAEAEADLSEFFARYVDGTEEIPLPQLLTRAGVEVKAREPWLDEDGKLLADAPRKRSWVGLSMRGNVVRNVEPGSPAWTAGLMRGDEIAAVSDRRTQDERAFRRELGRVSAGADASLSVFRKSRLLRKTVQVQDNPHRTYTFTLPKAADRTPALNAWLGLESAPASPAAATQ